MDVGGGWEQWMYPYCWTIINFEGHEKAKLIFNLKCICDVPIQNGGLQGVWISLRNNGCQNYGFQVIKKYS